MNDILKFLARRLRKHGYDIKRHNQYNLLPVLNLDSFPGLSSLYNNSLNKKDKFSSCLNHLYVCLRTCLRSNNIKKRPPEITGSNHEELVYRCVYSLVNSINHALRSMCDFRIDLIIFDDHSDAELKSNIEKLCENLNCNWELKTTKIMGQGNSLLEQFEFAREIDGLCYFCEDDYLHEESAIYEMICFYQQVYNVCNTHMVIHPQEHEFLYSRYIYPSYILLGDNRHWRTISDATHTLFMHAELVKKHWQYFENTRHVGDKKNRRLGSEAKTTNRLFEIYPGFAPIPAVAAHMQTIRCLPPLYKWEKLWDKNEPNIT